MQKRVDLQSEMDPEVNGVEGTLLRPRRDATGSTIATPGKGDGARRAARPRYGLIYALYAALVVMNIALPKGGVAFGTTPVTFGYMLVMLVAPVALIGLARRPAISPVPAFHFLAFFLPLALISLYKIMNGGGDPLYIVIYGTLFFGLPLSVLILFSSYLEELTENQIGSIFKYCVGFAIIWGIVNFLLFATSRNFLEIPYVTVNGADTGTIYSKNNARGALMKLVSTYNNGNVCGACFVMLLPIFLHFSKSRLWPVLLCVAILLTLSRTAWFGLICAFICLVALGQIRLAKPSLWIGAACLLALLVLLMPIMGWTPESIFDRDLGGRLGQWEDLELTLLGQDRVFMSEILYAGLLQSFGVGGFIIAFGAFAFPIGYGLLNLRRLSALRKAALAGIISYLLMAFSDAAFAFAPVFLQFLFLVALLYRRGYRPLAGMPDLDRKRQLGNRSLPLAKA